MLLGNVCKIRTGKLDANAGSPNGKYPFFTCAQTPLKIDFYKYDCECVLVAGNCDLNVKYFNGKFEAYQRTYIIEPLDKQQLDTKFLYYFISSYLDNLKNKRAGGVIKFIKLRDLTSIEIPNLELNEQIKCVHELESIERIRKAEEDSLICYDSLIKSRFIEMFGSAINDPSRICRFGDICKGIIGLTYSPNDICNGGILVLRSGNIQNNQLQIDKDLVRVSNPKINKEKYIKDLDILMCSRNGSARLVGKTCLIHRPKESMTWGAFMTVIRTEFPYILQNYMMSEYFKRQLTTTQTASVNQITNKMLMNYTFFRPKKDEENAFASFVEKVDKLKFNYL